MTIDEFGRISQVELLEKKYHDDEGQNLKIINANEVKPMEVRFSEVKPNVGAF
jgi:YidC/Oxa1 family membrane protein insertase